MKKETGLWIDHGQAIVVTLAGREERVEKIESNVGMRTRFSGASQAKVEAGSRDSWAEDVRDRRYEATLTRYYDQVISLLKGADAVLVLGPGEAKLEFQKRCQDKQSDVKIVGVESADKMTERQVVARVRKHFEKLH
jgi:stalled ribosome rescue protein Dom34